MNGRKGRVSRLEMEANEGERVACDETEMNGGNGRFPVSKPRQTRGERVSCVETEVNGREGRSPHLKQGERRGGRGCQGGGDEQVENGREGSYSRVRVESTQGRERPLPVRVDPIENESGGC